MFALILSDADSFLEGFIQGKPVSFINDTSLVVENLNIFTVVMMVSLHQHTLEIILFCNTNVNRCLREKQSYKINKTTDRN